MQQAPATVNPESARSRGQMWRAHIRARTYNMLRGLVPTESAIALADTDEPVDDAHFEQAVCRNCGAVRSEPHCGACGQKAVARLDLKDVFAEFWQAWRLFEASMVKGSLEMVKAPGSVAREYVLGARKRHIHPLKLLLFAVGFLIILLAKTRYLQSGQDELSPLMEQIVAWSRWSFTLTLLAILLASWLVFRKRLGYNPVEHLVLAVYAQFLIVAANVVNLLPLLAHNTPDWVVAHRAAARWYMSAIEIGIVALALVQFHRLRLPRELPRLLLALVVFYLAKEGLLFLYGKAILAYVLASAG